MSTEKAERRPELRRELLVLGRPQAHHLPHRLPPEKRVRAAVAPHPPTPTISVSFAITIQYPDAPSSVELLRRNQRKRAMRFKAYVVRTTTGIGNSNNCFTKLMTCPGATLPLSDREGYDEWRKRHDRFIERLDEEMAGSGREILAKRVKTVDQAIEQVRQ